MEDLDTICGCAGTESQDPRRHNMYLLQVLCGLRDNTNVSAGAGSIQYGSLPFGSVLSASYADLIATVSGQIMHMVIDNKLDKDVKVSFDGVATAFIVAAGTSMALPFAQAHKPLSIAALKVEAVGANATSGNIYATLIH